MVYQEDDGNNDDGEDEKVVSDNESMLNQVSDNWS